MKKVISIDFWNTLVDTSGTEERKRLRSEKSLELLRQHDPDLTETRLNAQVKAGIDWFNSVWVLEHKTPQTGELVERLTAGLNIDLSETESGELIRIFESGVLVAPPLPAPGLSDILPGLAKKYTLGIISDTHFSPGRVLKQLLEMHGLLSYFSVFAFSDERGVSKPHPEMYRHILRESGAEESEMVHIGDMNRTDIAGARALGIHSVLYTGINREDESATQADKIASHWHEIPGLITGF